MLTEAKGPVKLTKRAVVALFLFRCLDRFVKWTLGVVLIEIGAAFEINGSTYLVVSWSTEMRELSYRAKVNLRNDIIEAIREAKFD